LKVRFTPSARARFLREIDFIRQDRPMAAMRFRRRCEEILRRLEDFPESGRKIPEFPELPHREVLATPYRFFYRIAGNVVWIVAVWHDAQIPIPPEAGWE
jgi:toxin ParE1/3/4